MTALGGERGDERGDAPLRTGWRRRDRGDTAGLLSGPLLWLLLFFVAPVVYIAVYSVGAVRLFPTDTG